MLQAWFDCGSVKCKVPSTPPGTGLSRIQYRKFWTLNIHRCVHTVVKPKVMRSPEGYSDGQFQVVVFNIYHLNSCHECASSYFCRLHDIIFNVRFTVGCPRPYIYLIYGDNNKIKDLHLIGTHFKLITWLAFAFLLFSGQTKILQTVKANKNVNTDQTILDNF